MRPVDKRCRSRVDCFERAKLGGDVKVLRAINGTKHAAHNAKVVVQEPVRSDGVYGGLPGVPVCVDHAGDHDHSLGVDDEHVGRVYLVVDGSDAIAVDEDIAWSKVALIVVHRDDVTAFDQYFLTFAGTSLCRLRGTGTKARHSGDARHRRQTRGGNSGQKSPPVWLPMAHAGARLRLTYR